MWVPSPLPLFFQKYNRMKIITIFDIHAMTVYWYELQRGVIKAAAMEFGHKLKKG